MQTMKTFPGVGQQVLARQVTHDGKEHIINAIYVRPFERTMGGLDDDDAYEHSKLGHYWAEGWYELVFNQDDYIATDILDGKIVAWIAIPEGW